MSSITKESLIQ